MKSYQVEQLEDNDLHSQPTLVVMPLQRIMKNIVIMSFVFFMNFVAYMGLANLQSSLHIDEGMGTTTQSVLYATMAISCLFVPKLAMQKLGHKWCVTLSLLGYIVWMAANGYAGQTLSNVSVAFSTYIPYKIINSLGFFGAHRHGLIFGAEQ